ncbi:zinc-ribbon domain-containing protein [Bradyrhizobium sp. SZCCHNR1075]|uniref:zinc-ribbon domain-containing protein n=1 Tax=Bradyrhizobium sp. SZCCHNR1075 TaxID=3057362 RepID=UPI0039656000
MDCSKCGKAIADGSHFCPECGAQLDAPTKPSPHAQTRLTEKFPQTTPMGTRDQKEPADLVYPRNPPLSPHLCWLGVLLPGVPQIVYGQVWKGVVLLTAAFFVAALVTPAGLALIIASVWDAYKIGKKLASGQPVGKWEFAFPWRVGKDSHNEQN